MTGRRESDITSAPRSIRLPEYENAPVTTARPASAQS
jgi:hypothetical protein